MTEREMTLWGLMYSYVARCEETSPRPRTTTTPDDPPPRPRDATTNVRLVLMDLALRSPFIILKSGVHLQRLVSPQNTAHNKSL